MLDLYAELKSLAEGLEGRDVPHALCGGLAMAVYHSPRATVDIDLLVPEDRLEAAADVARELGYEFGAKPVTFAEGAVEIRRLTRADPDAGDLLSLDLIRVTPQLRGVWEARVRVQWEEGELTVVSRNGLIAMKRLRGSGIDREDIRALEESWDED